MFKTTHGVFIRSINCRGYQVWQLCEQSGERRISHEFRPGNVPNISMQFPAFFEGDMKVD